MDYRKLGNTGTSVSKLALGTMGFGTETPEKEAFQILDAFVDAGGNMIDTADVYGGGASEELIGRWIANNPSKAEKIILATKARFGTGPDVNDAGSSHVHLNRALNTSLRRMGVDTITLYQLHGWDPITPVEESLSFLDAAMRAGKIQYVGLSNFTGWQLQLFISTARAMGVRLPVTLQQQYSLVYREIEYEVIPAALHNELGLLPWGPLAGGFLTGKHQRASKPSPDTRLGRDNPMLQHMTNDLYQSDRKWAVVDAVKRVADDIGATPSQVALSWVANRPTVSAPIIGARTIGHLQSNLAAAQLMLAGEAIALLDSVSAPVPDDYPYGRFGVLQRARYIDSSDQALKEL